MKYAFKEWAVICQALAEGRQALILRKGGLAEPGGGFRLEHQRFWLFPTYTHQRPQDIQPAAHSLLEQVEAQRPPAGWIRLSHLAQVTGVYHVTDLVRALLLAHLHLWSEETVRQRFAYKEPGLFVLPVRVFRVETAQEIPDTARYQGCRSWVELEEDLPTGEVTPVLSDAAMADLHRSLDVLLNPTAIV